MNPQNNMPDPNQPNQEPTPRQDPWSTSQPIPQETEPATTSDVPQQQDVLGDQINAEPAPQPQAAFDTPINNTPTVVEPVVATAAPAPKRSKKPFLIGIIAASAVLLLGGTAAAYQFWYQNPDKVVTDSLVKALTAETMSYKGTLDTTAQSANLKVDFDGAATNSAFSGNAKATITMGAASVAVNGSLLVSQDNTVYFKIANAKDLANTFMQMMGGSSTAELDALIAKVDNKWIKVSADSMQDEDSKQQSQCFTDLSKKVEADKSYSQEVLDIYKKQRFVTVKESLGEQDGNLGYKLTVDQQKAKAFTADSKSTKLYAELQKCNKDFKLDENELFKGDDSDVTTDVELWANQWTHELAKLKITGSDKDGTSKATFVLNPTFNKPVSIDAPKNTVPVEEIQSDIEALMVSAMGGVSTDDDMMQMEEELMSQDLEL